MEETYPIEGYPYVSQLFKPSEHLAEYSKVLTETLYHKEGELKDKNDAVEKIACLMDIDLDECKELDELCSVSLLGSPAPEEVPPQTNAERRGKAKENTLLERATRTLVTAVELKAAQSRPVRYAKRIRDFRKIHMPEFASEPNLSTEFKVPKEIILIARIFPPFNSNTGSQTVSRVQDVMLLGSQSLISFREKISCVNDEVIVGENALDNDNSAQVPMKRLFTSGMFFFGDTFYCDMRDLMSKDYGEVIDRWVKDNPQMKLGPFRHRRMDECTLADLEIRLGYPYVFMHLGSCEHLITFVDARLMNPDDVQDVSQYPLTLEYACNTSYCSACDTYATSWIVEDDSMPTNPSFLCKTCYDVYYTRNGQRVNPAFCCMIPSGDQSKGGPPTESSS